MRQAAWLSSLLFVILYFLCVLLLQEMAKREKMNRQAQPKKKALVDIGGMLCTIIRPSCHRVMHVNVALSQQQICSAYTCTCKSAGNFNAENVLLSGLHVHVHVHVGFQYVVELCDDPSPYLQMFFACLAWDPREMYSFRHTCSFMSSRPCQLLTLNGVCECTLCFQIPVQNTRVLHHSPVVIFELLLYLMYRMPF